MAGLEDAGSQLRASGACDAWFGACDDITRRVAGKLSKQKKDFSAKFPGIVIQNT